MELIYFILTAYGLTQILVYGRILNKIRPSYNFFHCSMCVGWWVGLFLWAINGFTELFTFEYSTANAFILGCISSGVSYILDVLFDDEGINLKIRGDK